MTLFEIATGELPFEDFGHDQIRIKILRGDRPAFPDDGGIGTKLAAVAARCWNEEQGDRADFHAIVGLLSD